MPALLTRMSSRPKRSAASATIARQDWGSATSSGTKALRAPSVVSSATARSDFSRFRAATITAAPAPAIAAGYDGDPAGQIEQAHRALLRYLGISILRQHRPGRQPTLKQRARPQGRARQQRNAVSV